MRKFNLAEYDDVDTRIKRFYSENPNGRLITELVTDTDEMVVFKAYVYMNENDVIKATGYAKELRDMDLKTTNDGKEYESVNFTSWYENAETSSLGRALANAGYSGNKRPSRQEMMSVSAKLPDVIENYENRVGSGEESAVCKKCGAPMKQSKSTGKLYCSKLCWKTNGQNNS